LSIILFGQQTKGWWLLPIRIIPLLGGKKTNGGPMLWCKVRESWTTGFRLGRRVHTSGNQRKALFSNSRKRKEKSGGGVILGGQNANPAKGGVGKPA